MNKHVFASVVSVVFVSLVGCASDNASDPTQGSTAEPLTVSGGTVSGQIARDVSLDLTMDFRCERTTSSFTWTGSVIARDVAAEVRLQNNTKGTHTTDAESVTASVAIAPEEPITVSKKSETENWSMGNPWIWFQAYKGSQPIGDPFVVGRCTGGGGRFKKRFDFSALAALKLKVHPVDNDSCTRSSDQVMLDGTLESIGEISGKVWFRQNDVHFSSAQDADLNVIFLAKADDLVFAKSPHYGGAGGNPLVYLRLSRPETEWFKLGRCNKL